MSNSHQNLKICNKLISSDLNSDTNIEHVIYFQVQIKYLFVNINYTLNQQEISKKKIHAVEILLKLKNKKRKLVYLKIKKLLLKIHLILCQREIKI